MATGPNLVKTKTVTTTRVTVGLLLVAAFGLAAAGLIQLRSDALARSVTGSNTAQPAR